MVLFPYAVAKNTARLLAPQELQRDAPLAWEYLNANKRFLEGREQGSFKDVQWYRFGRTQNLGVWEQPKLMIPYMITSLSAYLDAGNSYYFINVTTGGYGITVDPSRVSLPYLCGLLNSRLLDCHFKQIAAVFHGGYYAANKQFIERLPIRTINVADPADTSRHDQMVGMVERMLALHKQLGAARTAFDKESIQRQIEITDRQIDRLVYELYGLTDEEIAVVEGTPG
jgi:hypothetical protein